MIGTRGTTSETEVKPDLVREAQEASAKATRDAIAEGISTGTTPESKDPISSKASDHLCPKAANVTALIEREMDKVRSSICIGEPSVLDGALSVASEGVKGTISKFGMSLGGAVGPVVGAGARVTGVSTGKAIAIGFAGGMAGAMVGAVVGECIDYAITDYKNYSDQAKQFLAYGEQVIGVVARRQTSCQRVEELRAKIEKNENRLAEIKLAQAKNDKDLENNKSHHCLQDGSSGKTGLFGMIGSLFSSTISETRSRYLEERRVFEKRQSDLVVESKKISEQQAANKADIQKEIEKQKGILRDEYALHNTGCKGFALASKAGLVKMSEWKGRPQLDQSYKELLDILDLSMQRAKPNGEGKSMGERNWSQVKPELDIEKSRVLLVNAIEKTLLTSAGVDGHGTSEETYEAVSSHMTGTAKTAIEGIVTIGTDIVKGIQDASEEEAKGAKIIGDKIAVACKGIVETVVDTTSRFAESYREHSEALDVLSRMYDDVQPPISKTSTSTVTSRLIEESDGSYTSSGSSDETPTLGTSSSSSSSSVPTTHQDSDDKNKDTTPEPVITLDTVNDGTSPLALTSI